MTKAVYKTTVYKTTMYLISILSRSKVGLLCGFLLFLVGCREGLESSVVGKLTCGGKPVPFAQIVFHSLDGGSMPYGVSLENGDYKILTGTSNGLQTGKYKVVVQASLPDVVVPKEYGSVATSNLEYQIKPGKNVINLELD